MVLDIALSGLFSLWNPSSQMQLILQKAHQRQNDEVTEDEKASCDDVIENDAPYMLENKVAQGAEDASEEAPISNSPMMPGPFFTISNATKDQGESRRSNSVPCAPPNYTPGVSLPAGVAHRARNDLSPSQELERSLVEGLFPHGEDNRSFPSSRTSPKTSDLPRKSVPSFKFASNEVIAIKSNFEEAILSKFLFLVVQALNFMALSCKGRQVAFTFLSFDFRKPYVLLQFSS